MHNIRYWDIHTGTVKTATHDSKDEIHYGDHPYNRSPASKHLMEVFTGSSNHTTNTEPTPVELKLKDNKAISPADIVQNALDSAPLPYTQAAAATISARNNTSINQFSSTNVDLGGFVGTTQKPDPPGSQDLIYKDDTNTLLSISEEVNDNSFEHPLKATIAS